MGRVLLLLAFGLMLLAALARRVRRTTWGAGLLPLLGLGLLAWLSRRDSPPARAAAPAPQLGGRLARCATCGVLVPAARALADDDGARAFCSPACRDAAAAQLAPPPASAVG